MTRAIGISIDGLRKEFDKVVALDDINLTIPKGTVVGLLGQNGAGKTTLVRLLSGVMKPSAGTAEIFGFDLIKETKNIKRITGLLPEEYALYEKLSVYEYLQFLSSLYDMESSIFQNRFTKLAERLDLDIMRNRLIDTLSKGQKQKVALIASLIHNPKVLFLDEPLSNLDITAQTEVKKIIEEYRRESRIIIIATHLLVNVEEICDYIVIINQGRTTFSGEIANFLGNFETMEQAYLSHVS